MKSTETDNKFTCDNCGRTFDKEWSDEEALDEALERFGTELFADTIAVVCDDCYQKIIGAIV